METYKSDKPETDAAIASFIYERLPLVDFTRKLERQRNLAIKSLRFIATLSHSDVLIASYALRDIEELNNPKTK